MDIYNNKKDLFNLLEIEDNFIYKDFSNKYKEKEILKKTGGTRKIKPPILKLKKVQKKILDEILSKQIPLKCIYGLNKKTGVKQNALIHSKYFRYQTLSLDIGDFFGSIHFKTIKEVYKKIGFNKENSNILAKISTIEESLPQGSPISPILSSLSVFDMDNDLLTYCKKRKLFYTRYVDDINISGIEIKDEDIFNVKSIIEKYRLKTNDKEKLYKENEIRIITGVCITDKGLTIKDTLKEEIKYLQFEILKELNNKNLKSIFSGKLAFYKYINLKESKKFLEDNI